jgi:hypothetical protein
VIGADYILLDEAQDTAPVMISILEQQEHAMLVIVGDDNQQIYTWRGARNAMQAFAGAPRRLLSQSFRFGQTVADVANAVLGTLEEPTDLVMTGNPAIPTRVCAVAEPRCSIFRTNAGAIDCLLAGQAEGRRGCLIGGTEEVVSFCRAAKDLQPEGPLAAVKGTTHPELGCFAKWSEVQEYAKEAEGADLRLMVKLIDDFGADAIVGALEAMPSEEDADFVCTTAHRSKGREWSSVKLGSDFPVANRLDDEGRRLVYVAATRAQEKLDLTACPTFCGGFEGVGEDRRLVPGIKIEYTVPMPSEADLAAYRAAKASPRPAVPASVASAPPPARLADRPATVAVGGGNGIPAADAGDPPPNTWARGRDGGWLVRGRTGQSGTVEVERRDGSKSWVAIKRTVWEDRAAGVALYEV